MRCHVLFFQFISLIISFFATIDAQLWRLDRPVPPSAPRPPALRRQAIGRAAPLPPVPPGPTPAGNPSPAIPRVTGYVYPNVTAWAPYHYPNATGKASYQSPNVTNDACLGPNGELGKLRKRLVSYYASSGTARPTGSPYEEVACSDPIAQMAQQHLTADNLLDVTHTDAPIVTKSSAQGKGDALAMENAQAKPTSARTSAEPFNPNDLTGMQMSQLHAALQPVQTGEPVVPAQSVSAPDQSSKSSSTSNMAPLQGPNGNAESSFGPHATALNLPVAESSANRATEGASPNGKPVGAETPKQPNTPGDAPKNINPSGDSPNQIDPSDSAQSRVESGNFGSSNAGSKPESVESESGPSIARPSGPAPGSSQGSGPIVPGSKVPALGSESPFGSNPPGASKNAPDSGNTPGPVLPLNPQTGGGAGSMPVSSNLAAESGSSPSPPSSGDNLTNSGTGSGPDSGSTNSSPSSNKAEGNTASAIESNQSSNNAGDNSAASDIQGQTPPSKSGSSGSGGADVIAIGSQSYTAQQTGSFVVVGSHTITKGAPAVTIASTPVSIGVDGNLVTGSNTIQLSPLPTSVTRPNSADALAIGSNSYTVQQAGSSIILGTNTIAPGAPAITIASEPVSLGVNGIIVAGSNTITLASPPIASTSPSAARLITIGSSPYSIHPTESDFVVVGSNTISKGAPAVTIASEPVSLATDGTLVVGSKTVALGSQATDLGAGSILSQAGPVPSGNPASKNGSSSTTTPGRPFDAGSSRLSASAGVFRWAVGASTVVAVFSYGLL